MKLLALLLCACFLLMPIHSAPAQAPAADELKRPRIWTDINGGQLQAIFVEADGDNIVLRTRDGRHIHINRFQFSEADLQFLDAALSPPDSGEEDTFDFNPSDEEPTEPKAVFLAGHELQPGEKNILILPIAPDDRTAIQSSNPDVVQVHFGIWIPSGFDPARPWRIFAISQTSSASSVDHMDCYLDAARASPGWIVIAADGTAIPPANDNNELRWRTLRTGLNAIAAEWPQARNWPIVAGGFSGGAKRSGYIAALLMNDRWNLIGMFMGGCNQDMASRALEEYHPDPSAFLNIPIFLATGTRDEVASVEKMEKVYNRMKRTGFHRLRMETYDGAHDPDTASTIDALAWFIERQDDPVPEEPASTSSKTRPVQRPQIQRPDRPQFQRPAYTPPSKR